MKRIDLISFDSLKIVPECEETTIKCEELLLKVIEKHNSCFSPDPWPFNKKGLKKIVKYLNDKNIGEYFVAGSYVG